MCETAPQLVYFIQRNKFPIEAKNLECVKRQRGILGTFNLLATFLIKKNNVILKRKIPRKVNVKNTEVSVEKLSYRLMCQRFYPKRENIQRSFAPPCFSVCTNIRHEKIRDHQWKPPQNICYLLLIRLLYKIKREMYEREGG